MNPFNDILEATGPHSHPSLSGPKSFHLKADALDRYDESTDPADNRTLSLSDDTHEQSLDDEVYTILLRLQQLLGHVDTAPILERLTQVKEKGGTSNAASKIAPNISFKQVDTKKNGRARSAHFSVTAPVVFHHEERQDSHDSHDHHHHQQRDRRVSYSDQLDMDDIDGSTKSTNRSRFSRYSLGSNRFSARARQLSLGTLNYVGTNKLLRPTSRQFGSPDPLSYMSPSKPGKKPQPRTGTMDGYFDECPLPRTEVENPNFVEFCVIGVEADMLNGLKSLESSSLQPTEVLHMYPLDPTRVAVVSNLHEYCFPHGAELRYATHRDLEQLKVGTSSGNGNGTGTGSGHNSPAPSGNAHGLRYQTMQFTDAAGVVFYAVCVVSSEPIEQVNSDLLKNMAAVQNSIAAANTIKRYIRYYQYRKKLYANAELNAKWIENMRMLQGKSVSTRSVGWSSSSNPESKSSKSGSSHSLLKAIKRTMGVSFKPVKEALRFHGHSDRSLAMEKGSESSSLTSSPAAPGTGKRKTMTQKTTSATNTPSMSPAPPLSATPGSAHSPSPMLLRQRSKSFTSPALTLLRGTSKDDDFPPSAGSKDGKGISLLRQSLAAEVEVDGSPSPYKHQALQEALEHSKRKVALVTQRAYCIISDKPMHPIFFQILEAIALKERDRALTRWRCITQMTGDAFLAPTSPMSRGPNVGIGQLFREASLSNPNSVTAHVARRNRFLEHLQYYEFVKSPGKDARRPVSAARQSLRYVEIVGQDYMNHLRICTRSLSLKEWTVALLLYLVPSELIVKIHSLLLQELSLLVYGTDAGIVTAVATAFSLLLQPFSWEGIFVPLLPIAAYEALDAPVPFIVGVVSPSRPIAQISSSAGMLCIDDFILHPDLYIPSCFDEATLRNTLATHPTAARDSSVVGVVRGGKTLTGGRQLKFFEAPCPEDNQHAAPPQLDPLHCSGLKELHQFVAYHAHKVKACIRTLFGNRLAGFNASALIKCIMFDLSSEALRSLTSALDRVHAYNSSLCGEVLTQPGGWRQFGVLNSQTDQFEFLPELFLQPMKANLRLQESVINTQLFVSFMDEQSEHYLKLQPQRLFIGEWVRYRMILRRKRRHKRTPSRLRLF